MMIIISVSNKLIKVMQKGLKSYERDQHEASYDLVEQVQEVLMVEDIH